jgi:hypothetical protein
MTAVNNVFVKSLDEYVKEVFPTLQTNTPWTWCVRENSTYLDCPVTEHNYDSNITIAAYNPAASPIDYVSVVINSTFYSV